MKVKVTIAREVEIEVKENSAIAILDKSLRKKEFIPSTSKAIKEIETAVGLPFGDENAPQTIISVIAEDGEAILEW